jgi:16S rRNA (cytosine967-C5)-methyltransferase
MDALTPARRAAAKALHLVFEEGRRIPDTWDKALQGPEAGLSQALLGLCLRHWGRLGAYVQPRLKQPDRGIPLGSAIALAQGLASLAWLDGVAAHAAVHQAVCLAADPELGFPAHRGLVNAMLRRASEDRAGLKAELEALDADLDRTEFVNRVLEAAVAPTKGDVEVLWQRICAPPTFAFVALKGDVPEGLRPDEEIPGAYKLDPGAPFPTTWLADGRGMVQDRSSQALMSFQWAGQPQRVLDVCAAPGGKSTMLSRRFPAAKLIALEQSPARAERMKENFERRGVKAEVQVTEAVSWLQGGGRPFDVILVDAPCSGSGTLQKHPELGWLGDELDLGDLQRRQSQLLRAAADRLAPGGLLIYAVCSWLPEEGQAHADALLKARPEMSPASVWPTFGGATFRPDPCQWRGEGFQGFAFTKR